MMYSAFELLPDSWWSDLTPGIFRPSLAALMPSAMSTMRPPASNGVNRAKGEADPAVSEEVQVQALAVEQAQEAGIGPGLES